MDMCVCENQNKTENSETEKSSNNPLPQNTTDTQIVPLSLVYYCWKSVTMFGCDVVESRMFQLVQFTKINYRKQKTKKCKCKQYNVVAV